jgi:hypothetical protein
MLALCSAAVVIVKVLHSHEIRRLMPFKIALDFGAVGCSALRGVRVRCVHNGLGGIKRVIQDVHF